MQPLAKSFKYPIKLTKQINQSINQSIDKLELSLNHLKPETTGLNETSSSFFFFFLFLPGSPLHGDD